MAKAARRHDKATALATSLSQCSEALQLQVLPPSSALSVPTLLPHVTSALRCPAVRSSLP